MASIGERLKEAREAQNKSLNEVSSETNISKKYLEALEENSFEIFPAEVYVRGFLKNYSNALGLEAQDILDEYSKLRKLNVAHEFEKRVEKHDAEDDIFQIENEIIGERRKSRKGLVIALLLIIVVIVAVLAYLYTQNMILSTKG